MPRFDKPKRTLIISMSVFFLIVLGIKLPANITDFNKPKPRPRAVISQIFKSVSGIGKQEIVKSYFDVCGADTTHLVYHESPPEVFFSCTAQKHAGDNTYQLPGNRSPPAVPRHS